MVKCITLFHEVGLKYNDFFKVCTDGSRSGNGVGCSVVGEVHG